MTPPLPTFLILGAMKAGTSSLSYWLGEHPDIFLAPGKELFFFNVRWERGLDWYRSQFAGAAGEHAIFEATPGYLGNPEVPGRVAQTLPGVRLIALLRHPADRMHSQYWHNRAMGLEKRPFAGMVDEELSGRTPAFGFYLERGRYLDHLNTLKEHFSEDAILALLFEDMTADPIATFETACRFVGVDEAIRPENVGQVYNAARLSFRSPRLRHTVARLRARRLVSAKMADRINKLNTNWRRRPYEPMDPEIRVKLIEAYEEQTAGLEKLLGRDLSAWRR